MGRGRAGEAAAPLEVLHPANGRHRVRGGLHRAGAHGGGPGGAPQDHPHLREPGGARAGPGQQAGPGLGSVRRRGGEAAVRARTEHVHAASRAGLQRRGRPGAAGGPGETLRADPEEEEGREAQPEQEEMSSERRAGLEELRSLLGHFRA